MWDIAAVGLVELCGSPAGLSGRELGDRLVEIERVRRVLEAATVAVLDEADRSGSFRDDGHVTLGSWARATVNWSYGEAMGRVREVDLVRLCPKVGVELAGGQLGVAQVGELARARANPRAGDRIADCIDELVGWAESLGFDGFRKVVRRWEQLADVEGAHRGHEAAHEGRRASITRFDDTFHFTAQFGVVQGSRDRQGPRSLRRGRVPGRLGQGEGRARRRRTAEDVGAHRESAARSTRCSLRSWRRSKTTRASCPARW